MQTEVFPLAMFSLGGMMLFPAANNLLLMFVALEVLCFPLYLMAGLARRRRLLSQEAAVKYFLLGSFASAFFIYGVALLYGYAGSVDIGAISDATQLAGKSDVLLFLGIAMLSVGLLFKIGAVPFQAWTPDVYQGSPTPVTALMAAATKISAFGAILRVFYVAFERSTWDWRPMMWADRDHHDGRRRPARGHPDRRQADARLLLDRAHRLHLGRRHRGQLQGAGGHAVLPRDLRLHDDGRLRDRHAGPRRQRRGDAPGPVDRSRASAARSSPASSRSCCSPWPGSRSPAASWPSSPSSQRASRAVPPRWSSSASIASAITAFFYARVVVLMFFNEPAPDGPTVAVPGGFTAATIALGLGVTVVLGVLPQPVLDLADRAALFVR